MRSEVMSFKVCGSGANKRHLSPQKQGQDLFPTFSRLNHFLLNESKECIEIYLDATLSGDCWKAAYPTSLTILSLISSQLEVARRNFPTVAQYGQYEMLLVFFTIYTKEVPSYPEPIFSKKVMSHFWLLCSMKAAFFGLLAKDSCFFQNIQIF